MNRIPAGEAAASRAETSERAQQTARRSLLALGGVAGVGLTALFTASPAQAKAGDPLRAGRTVDAGTAGTGLKTKSSKSGLAITQGGAGVALRVAATGAGPGLLSTVVARTRTAIRAEQNATTTDPNGSGVALLALGHKNVAVRATTSSSAKAVPAVVATGAGGLGIALLATGSALLDGDLLALRSLIGVLDSAGELAYAHASSGDHATHTRHGVATLGSDGRATIALGSKFTKAVSMDTLVVQLTPQGASMSGLYSVASGTGFEIRGGAASGKVAWVAFADRLVLTLTSAKGPSTTTSAAGAVQRSSTLAGRGALRPELHGSID